MNAKIQCSNCGEEISNLTMTWGKNQWLIGLIGFLPMILVLYWFVWSDFQRRPRAEFSTDIEVTQTSIRASDQAIDVLGKLENVGESAWESITVEAEFFDSDGQFLDEAANYLPVLLVPGGVEYFRITLKDPIDQLSDDDANVVLKITDAGVPL